MDELLLRNILTLNEGSDDAQFITSFIKDIELLNITVEKVKAFTHLFKIKFADKINNIDTCKICKESIMRNDEIERRGTKRIDVTSHIDQCEDTGGAFIETHGILIDNIMETYHIKKLFEAIFYSCKNQIYSKDDISEALSNELVKSFSNILYLLVDSMKICAKLEQPIKKIIYNLIYLIMNETSGNSNKKGEKNEEVRDEDEIKDKTEELDDSINCDSKIIYESKNAYSDVKNILEEQRNLSGIDDKVKTIIDKSADAKKNSGKYIMESQSDIKIVDEHKNAIDNGKENNRFTNSSENIFMKFNDHISTDHVIFICKILNVLFNNLNSISKKSNAVKTLRDSSTSETLVNMNLKITNFILFLFKKINILIKNRKYKSFCFEFYPNFINFLQLIRKDKIVLEYLHGIIFDNEEQSEEFKLVLITLLFDNIIIYIQHFTDFNETDVLKSTESDTSQIYSYLNKIELHQFYQRLKKFIINNLTNNNIHIRKSGLYLMKRIYEIENVNKSNYWEMFFHMFETLEEKQVHLIIPVINDLSVLVNKQCPHPIFIEIILGRMLQQESVTIVKLALEKLHLITNDVTKVSNLLPIIVQALNASRIFIPQSELISNSFVSLFKLINNPYEDLNLYLKFIENVAIVSWGPIPLFYVIYYLQQSSNKDAHPNLVIEDIEKQLKTVMNHLKKIIQLDFKHNVYIRSAMHSCLIEHIQYDVVSPLQQLNIVNSASTATILIDLLNSMKQKFTSTDLGELYLTVANVVNFTEPFANDFINENLISENENINSSILPLVVLFLKANIVSWEQFVSIVKSKWHSLEARKCSENVKKLIDFVKNYSDILIHSVHLREKKLNSLVFSYCDVQSTPSMPPESDAHFVLCADEFIIFFQEDNLQNNFEYVRWWLQYSLAANSVIYNQIMKRVSFEFGHFGIFETELNYLIFTSLLLETNKHTRYTNSAQEWCERNKENLIFMFDKKHAFKRNNDARDNIVKLKLNIMNTLVEEWSDDTWLSNLHFIFIEGAMCIDYLNNIDKDSLPDFLNLMSAILQYHFQGTVRQESNLTILRFIENSWVEVSNLRRTPNYRKSITLWVKAIFQDVIFKSEAFQKTLKDYLEMVLCHDESMLILFKTLFLIPLNTDVMKEAILNGETHMWVILKGLIYGELPKRDILCERMVCDFIKKNQLSCVSNIDWHFSTTVRLLATSIMIELCVEYESYGVKLLNNLMAAFDESPSNYFHDSLTHRIKQRCIQNILILSSIVTLRNTKDILFSWTIEKLVTHNHQPSVRYYLEWIIILNLGNTCDERFFIFWKYFDRAYDERPGSIVSFISIIYHVVRHMHSTQDSKFPEFLVNAFERLTSCSMSQLFNVRLYAHVVFSKVCEEIGPDHPQMIQFQMVYMAMKRTAESAKGNAIVNCEKLKTDFYFNHFEPHHQLTLETIFYDIPRLANVAPDEWVSPTAFEEYFKGSMLIRNQPEYSLEDVERPEWILSNTSTSHSEPSDLHTFDDLVSQKKYIPWKSMGIHMVSPSTPSTTSNLIIVTSLIDKIPNVGGLARTCEILGATLVVESLEIINDVQFKALSMTSEKHLNIVEVRKHNLKQFLTLKRAEQNFSLIGAEQTNSSVNLQDFKYPKKCVLVLGNEKDGVPSDILLLLDTCVEIPQLGVLRSLNVHVTGAIFIWEYVKQHSLC